MSGTDMACVPVVPEVVGLVALLISPRLVAELRNGWHQQSGERSEAGSEAER